MSKAILDQWEVSLLKSFCDHLTQEFDSQKVWSSFDRFLGDYRLVKGGADEVSGSEETEVDG